MGFSKEKTNGYIKNLCDKHCPTECDSWKSFESTRHPWKVDPGLTVECGGKYSWYTINWKIKFFSNQLMIVDNLRLIWIFSLDCTMNGRPGDGTTRGSCNEHELCLQNGTCTKSMCIENYIYKTF